MHNGHLMHVSAIIYSTWVVAMLSSGLITFTNMSLYLPGRWPCLFTVYAWMVAMFIYLPVWCLCLFIYLDGG